MLDDAMVERAEAATRGRALGLGRLALRHRIGLAAEELSLFRKELGKQAVERLRAFSILLFVVHLGLVVHDLVQAPAESAPERTWQSWLFVLHVMMLVGTALSMLVSQLTANAASKARVAYITTAFFLVWSGVLSGVDQLIGAGITVYLIVAIGSALFVTFESLPTYLAFGAGYAAFLAGQLAFTTEPPLAFSQGINGAGFTAVCVIFSRMLYRTKARDFEQRVTIERQHSALAAVNEKLEAERQKTEKLLSAVLPARIVERLRAGEAPIADSHEKLTIVMADLCDFTQLASALKPPELVELLDELFSEFDGVAKSHALEKIKTIGDGYLAVLGIEKPTSHDAIAAADAALSMHLKVAEVAARRGRDLHLRVGIARGEAMAGVLGRERLLYDLWGDAVNVASRLETAARPGETLVTAELAALLAETHDLGPESLRELKGKGRAVVRSVIARLPR